MMQLIGSTAVFHLKMLQKYPKGGGGWGGVKKLNIAVCHRFRRMNANNFHYTSEYTTTSYISIN